MQLITILSSLFITNLKVLHAWLNNLTLKWKLAAINPLKKQLNYFLWQIQLLRSFVILIEWFHHTGWITFTKPVHADNSSFSGPVHTSRSAWTISTFGGTQKAQTPLKPWWLIFDPEKGLLNSTASDVMCAKGRTGIKILGNARFSCTKNKSEWMRWMWRHLTLTRRFKFLPFGVEVVNLSSRRETRIGCVCLTFSSEKCWLFDWNLNLFCQLNPRSSRFVRVLLALR